MPDTPAVLRTVVASDNFLTREGLACLLHGVESIEVVARVNSHPETLDAVCQYHADVLIVGIRTPRVAAEASLSAAKRLRAEHPDIGVVVIAEAGDGYALELLRCGAAHTGYLLDDRVGDLETVVSAIHGAHAGETVLDPSIVNSLVRRRAPSALDELSSREFNVLAEMANGYANNRSPGTCPCRRKESRSTSPASSASSACRTPSGSTAGSPRCWSTNKRSGS